MPPRKAPPLSSEEVKAAADRAEGKAPEPKEARGGRPTKYRPGFAKQAEKLCQLGATDDDIAQFFEVDVRTIARWKLDFPEFCQALKSGKSAADERVERSLYHKAVGYTFDAVKIFMPAGASEPVYAPYREHVPPDTTACIFWLKNRRQQQWRDVHKHEHGQPGDFERMDDTTLLRAVAEEAKALGLPVEDGKAAGTKH